MEALKGFKGITEGILLNYDKREFSNPVGKGADAYDLYMIGITDEKGL